MASKRTGTKPASKAEVEVKAAQAWAGYLARLDDVQRQVLIDNKLLKPDGRTPVVTEYIAEGDIFKTKIALNALKTLMALDPTRDHRWTAWIINEAGGGAAAKVKSNEAVDTALRAYRIDNERLVAQGRKSQAELDAELAGFREAMVELMSSGDEDSLRLTGGAYGFAYDFPGAQNRYANVKTACQRFFELYRQGIAANTRLQDAGEEVIPWEPDQLNSLTAMVNATTVMARRIASFKAETDVRVAEWPDPLNPGWKAQTHADRKSWKNQDAWKKRRTVYDDDYVTVIVPLTYAAAVEYGNDAWPISNRDHFKRALRAGSGNDPWSTQRALSAFLTFNVPMPTIHKYDDTNLEGITSLQRLHVEAAAADLARLTLNDLTFTDLNGTKHTFQKVADLIRSEATRSTTPVPGEAKLPFTDRGAAVYKTEQEAEQVVEHLTAACKAIIQWAAKHLVSANFVRRPFES